MTAVSPKTPSLRRRVVVTGMGAVTALGSDLESTWQNILAGATSAAPIQRFDASGFPTTFACEVSAEATAGCADGSRALTFARLAAQEAWTQAECEGAGLNRGRCAVLLGVGMGTPSLEWFDTHVLAPEASVSGAGLSADELIPEQPIDAARHLAQLFDLRGGNLSMHTACASSAQALADACEWIRCGGRDLVVAGGTDAMIEPFQLVGFSLLGALSKRNGTPATAARPFDVCREGFVLGEGAAVLILEERGHALRRGATILAEVLGVGETASAYRITDLDPEGAGPFKAMEAALLDAGLSGQEVEYVNAHGTGTLLNDAIESRAIARATPRARVSSTKPMVGHLIAGAGAAEAAFSVLVLRDQTLPPTLNVEQQDPECPVLLTSSVGQRANVRYAMSNSIGFGGSNCSLILGLPGAAATLEEG